MNMVKSLRKMSEKNFSVLSRDICFVDKLCIQFSKLLAYIERMTFSGISSRLFVVAIFS